jgi:ferredoxin-fold anticodon binding domain-containing protein
MGWSVLKIKNDPIEGKILVAGGEIRKGGAWIARITGIDEKYKYTREFLGKRHYVGRHGKLVEVHVPITDLNEGDLLDIRSGGSWKNAYRDYYVYENGNVRVISETELRRRLAERLKKQSSNVISLNS